MKYLLIHIVWDRWQGMTLLHGIIYLNLSIFTNYVFWLVETAVVFVTMSNKRFIIKFP